MEVGRARFCGGLLTYLFLKSFIAYQHAILLSKRRGREYFENSSTTIIQKMKFHPRARTAEASAWCDEQPSLSSRF
jgi:hypothetical protein